MQATGLSTDLVYSPNVAKISTTPFWQSDTMLMATGYSKTLGAPVGDRTVSSPSRLATPVLFARFWQMSFD
jgi:hypothetical protein